MISYQDIANVNEEVKAVEIKNKDYAVVPERIKAFRKLFPNGYICTEIIHLEKGENQKFSIIMQATAGYYDDEGVAHILGTGTAQEYEDSDYINKRSYVENCETSAIGRAIGAIGLIGASSIATAEEVANAMEKKAQNKSQASSKYICADCLKHIYGVVVNGENISSKEISEKSMNEYGRQLCVECAKKAKAKKEAESNEG